MQRGSAKDQGHTAKDHGGARGSSKDQGAEGLIEDQGGRGAQAKIRGPLN